MWADFTLSIIRAKAAARKALELGPESAEALAVMGTVHLYMDRFDEGRIALEKAIQISPNLAEASTELGLHYSTFGRFGEAIEYLRKARTLDPLDPYPAIVLMNVLRVIGKVDEALLVGEGLKELHQRDPVCYVKIAECYMQKKDFAKARDALDIGLRFSIGDNQLRIARGSLCAMSGRNEDARDELRDLMKDDSESIRLTAQLWIGTALGDIDEAFVALMRQAEVHNWWSLIRFDPLFERLRKDPRFSEFCLKVGLPPQDIANE